MRWRRRQTWDPAESISTNQSMCFLVCNIASFLVAIAWPHLQSSVSEKLKKNSKQTCFCFPWFPSQKSVGPTLIICGQKNTNPTAPSVGNYRLELQPLHRWCPGRNLKFWSLKKVDFLSTSNKQDSLCFPYNQRYSVGQPGSIQTLEQGNS